MNGCADYTPSPSDPSKEPVEPWPSQAPLQEDVDMSDGTSGNETNENGSMGQDSRGSNCDDSGRELGMLVGPPGTCQGWVCLRPPRRGRAFVFSVSHSVLLRLLLQSLNLDDQVF